MRLNNGILRPGIVLEVIDNKGTIKASAPGLFSEVDKDNLPPITPLYLSHSNQFSTPTVNDEVWILNFTSNTQQLYWFRKDDYISNNEKLLEEENVEVICNKEGEMGWATIYFSNGSGWIIRNDRSVIQIDPEGNILLENPNPHRTIHINDNNISIGSKGESAHPAAYGDKVSDLLWKIYMTFEAIKTSSSVNPYTANIGAAITSIGDWSGEIGDIESSHVTID